MVARSKPPNQLPQHISTTNLRDQQFLSHAIHHFATPGGSTQPPTDLNFFRSWITTLRHPNSTCTSLQASPLACCAAWFARNDQNPSMIDYSRQLYTQGLQEVRQALRVPELVLKDETLGACLALTVFEVSGCPDRNRVAYDWHRRANLNLLLMRGAKQHREGVGHELFLAARLHGVSVIHPVQPSSTREKLPSRRTPSESVSRSSTPTTSAHRISSAPVNGSQSPGNISSKTISTASQTS